MTQTTQVPTVPMRPSEPGRPRVTRVATPPPQEVEPHEPYDTLRQQGDAATLGMWIFLGTELLFFGGMICAYTVYRVTYPEAWAIGSEHLFQWIGGTNTAVLLCSSFTAALAVRAAAGQRRGGVIGWLLATAFFALAFLCLKGYEYYLDYGEGLVPGRWFAYDGPHRAGVELFMFFYFVMTLVHAFHMLMGIISMGVLLTFAFRRKLPDPAGNAVEIFGMYWHFVDLVWLFLLPLLYLIG